MSDATSAIFISYAREDSVAADRIAEALRSHGIEVWFDQNELRGGEAWDQKIRNQIRTCSLLIPIVSAHTQGRGEGYFRREWKFAAERTHDMAAGIPFLVPVVIDDTPESAALVPEEFMKVQWTRLHHGRTTPEFAAQVKRLLEKPRAAAPARPAPAATPSAPGSPPPAAGRSSGVPLWAVAAMAITALGAVLYFALRPTARPPATPLPIAAAPKPSALAPATTPQAIADKSIAVLPLDNMSDDKDTGFFADGVHEDLLTNLALVPELKVVSRTSVMQYRDTKKTIKQIGEELGVAYVLEGSVRRAGNKVRVTGQLINTRTDEHVWAESYDRDLTDIFSIQAELSKKIAGALSAAISPQTKKFLERKPTENPVAYDDYLKGRDSRNRSRSGIPSAMREQEGFFKSAVQQDPNFAAAWGELAVVHALNVFWEVDHSPARLEEADAAIAQAVRLAPDAPDVIRSLGTYAYYAYRDYARATEQYEKLARLQPNDPTVFASLGLIQRRQGRFAESLVNLRRAVELDPANVSYTRNLLASLDRARRWDEARTAQQRLVTLLPDRLFEQFALADLEFSANGSMKAADALLARLSPAQRDSPTGIYWRKLWAINRGDFGEFKRLDQLHPSFDEEEDPVISALIAGTIYLVTGDSVALHARLDAPLVEWRARAQREPVNAKAWSFLSNIEALLGQAEAAVQHARKAAELIPESRDAMDGPTYRYLLAWVYAITGDKDRAMTELTRLMQIPTGWNVAGIRTNPGFAKLRGDPRFEALLNDPKNNAPLF
jgi:TolB-like protein/Flp pilus assembly protein TadD